MENDVTWWNTPKRDHGQQNQPHTGTEVPGDTDAPDIVGRTGEEMPEVAHDNGPDHLEGEADED